MEVLKEWDPRSSLPLVRPGFQAGCGRHPEFTAAWMASHKPTHLCVGHGRRNPVWSRKGNCSSIMSELYRTIFWEAEICIYDEGSKYVFISPQYDYIIEGHCNRSPGKLCWMKTGNCLSALIGAMPASYMVPGKAGASCSLPEIFSVYTQVINFCVPLAHIFDSDRDLGQYWLR